MPLDTLRPSLTRALADPAVQADLLTCRHRLVLVLAGGDGPGDAIELTLGREGGGTVELQAGETVWAEALGELPDPGRQSIGAMRRPGGGLVIAGSDLHIAQALPLMERLLAAWRRAAVGAGGAAHPAGSTAPSPSAGRGPSTPGVAPARPRHHDALPHLRGGYLQLAESPDTWVHGEECGPTDAPALLMLHTAGADARQWHGLMAQAELRRDWRLMAFDLPGHGRSPLPAGEPNWTWRLTESRYVDWVLRWLDAQRLDRVVLMGCSMGAAIGLPLLARHPDRFHGAVLLETPYRSPGRRSPFLNHAEVHGGRLAAAWVGALLSPRSPESGRDHATWIYSQGAPSVYDGDLAFYSDDFDAHAHTGAIDTARTPLWLLTGDYDYSATPADTRRVAAEIPGAEFREMAGLGHFPMVEDPDALMGWLRAPLAALNARAAGR